MVGGSTSCDVLVVGAGSAGSVLAARLSSDPGCHVAVIEAGTGVAAESAVANRLPIGAGSALVHRYSARLTDAPAREATLIRGNTVGGSGAVNGGYFCRAPAGDFDDYGIAGWAWPDVLEHFQAIETDLDFSGSAHGDHGPVPVRRCTEFVGVTAEFVDAARSLGLGWLTDLNDAGPVLPTGIGAVPQNIVDGTRIGPGAAFLLPALARPNLRLITGARAQRLHIVSGRAVGVEVIGPQGVSTVSADRIVLCAGAIESAHLLMLSGVGDEAMLRAAGVPVVAALPVGAAFSDHPEWLVGVDWPTARDRPVLEVVASTVEGLEIRPYTAGFATMVGDEQRGADDRPQIGVALMRPRTRGRMSLVSADPAVPPLIEHHYDSEPGDVAALRRGVELVGELIGAPVRNPAWSTSQHLCGTAPMGPVVDERCRVRGVDGLWVVDGAVLPRVPSRGPHATITMIGHRAAEFVVG